MQVKFKRKTKRVITLAEMKDYAGSELSEMPLLKAARLSVSAVPKSCWDYILDVLEGKGTEMEEGDEGKGKGKGEKDADRA